MNSKKFFIAIDGDLVGRKLEKLIISEKLDELVIYAQSIDNTINKFRSFAEAYNGKIYLQGGDSLLFEIPEYKLFLEKVKSIQSNIPTSFSIGIGISAVEAYLALKFAKSSGSGLIFIVKNVDNKITFKQIL